MLLSELIGPPAGGHVIGGDDPNITSIVYDSRKTTPGALFVCIRGEHFDGHSFAASAVGGGACAVVAERDLTGEVSGVPVVVVPDTRAALPVLANRFYDHPSRRLKLVGVTGTKGKTTTTYLVESILQHGGRDAGVIGTLGARIRGREVPLDRTTPESVDLQEILAAMVSAGVSATAMEVSSHALVLKRTQGCEYDVGIFTNLTHDHLDFHGTPEQYLEAKLMLFTEYPRASSKQFTGVVNVDDPAGERVRDETVGRVLTFGIRNEADIRASNIDAGANGVSFDVDSPVGRFHVDLCIGGRFNVYDSLGAIGAAVVLGIGVDAIEAGLESVRSVAGRFEYVDCGQDFGVIVDYAHTPDSLENILRAARDLTSGRLITVFGCGGDRDRKKRPVMGRIGSEMADVCVVTSDNPRSEDPQAIIDEILTGTTGDAVLEVIPDRKEAIFRALEIASAGDLVVIAGKGHETYQIFRDETIHFDDREVAREALRCDRDG